MARARANRRPPARKNTRTTPARPPVTRAQSRSLSPFHRSGPLIPLGAPAQLKPKIGRPGDAFEREADAASARALRGEPAGPISRLTPALLGGHAQRQEASEETDETLQREIAEPEEEVIQNQSATETPEDEEAVQPQSESAEPIEEEEPVQAQMEPSEDEEAIQAQSTTEMPDDEEPVQSQAAGEMTEDEEPVQAQTTGEVPEEEEPLQRQAEPEEEDEEPVQMATRGGAAMQDAAAEAIRSRGPGDPLRPDVRERLESSFGVGLDDVRVHDDQRANESARALNARAFTNQSDIWLGAGESQSDLGLMAHEAAHVIQQTGSVHRQLVQRADPPAGSEWQNEFSKRGVGKVNRLTKQIEIASLSVPRFKKKFLTPPFTLPKKTDEARPDDQRQVWEEAAKAAGAFDEKLKAKIAAEESPRMSRGGVPMYYFKLNREDNYVIGTATAVRNRLLRPFWDPQGRREFYDVDHQRELQLGGDNTISNMWLLESQANRSSGRNIRGARNRAIQAVLDAAVGTVWPTAPDLEQVRRDYTITVQNVRGDLPVDGDPRKVWTIEDVRDKLQPLEGLKALTKREIERSGIAGGPSELAIFSNETGGGLRRIPWSDETTSKAGLELPFGQNFTVNSVNYQKSQGGKLAGLAFRDQGSGRRILEEAPLDFDVQESDFVDYGGFVPAASVTRAARSALKLHGLSPIRIDYAELHPTKGLVGRGKVLPTVPLIAKADIDIVIDGNDVYLSKVFSAGDFDFPGPVTVTGTTLEVFAGTQGLGARGNVLFEVERVGRGKLSGEVSTSTGFGVAGEFEFDSTLFDPAKIQVWYREEKLGGSGELAIKSGKVRGIKSARITAAVDGENWSAEGTVEPDVPGIKSGTLTANYNPETGLEIGGSLLLGEDLPAVKSGTLTANLKQRPEGEGYILSASGLVVLDIPGVDASVAASYDDGAFTASGTVAYEKGMLKGTATFGVTNRAIVDNQPTGEATENLTAFGSGLVTIRIAPWLQGSVGIRLLPNGEIEVSGSIGLPDTIDVFPEKSLDKNIFSIGIDIPIIGVAAAGQRVGIFANISGSLSARAAIGPGQLRQMKLSVTYNPDRESETTVTGTALFAIPASAGLRLAVRGSLGAGIPLVSASAGLEVGGELGLAGEASAAVQVDWTPARGLELAAQGRLMVEPRFTFDISGFVLVELDLWLKTIELYSKRWQLASFEYGSGLQFGVIFPIAYREGQPFDISLSDIQFVYPNIDTRALISGLVKQVV